MMPLVAGRERTRGGRFRGGVRRETGGDGN